MTNDKLERVARAILDEMDITDGLDAESAERYAAAAIAACEAEAGEPTEAMIEAALTDLRDRRLLKWLFSANADTDPHPIGYIDGPINCATQREVISAIYTAMRRAALTTAGEGEVG